MSESSPPRDDRPPRDDDRPPRDSFDDRPPRDDGPRGRGPGRGPGGREDRPRREMSPKGRLRAKARKKARKAAKKMFVRRKVCRFCADKNVAIDYKEAKGLRLFISETGKVVPRRISGNCAKHQRALAVAIKRARVIAILPYTEQGF